jgi:hypothetical protein
MFASVCLVFVANRWEYLSSSICVVHLFGVRFIELYIILPETYRSYCNTKKDTNIVYRGHEEIIFHAGNPDGQLTP